MALEGGDDRAHSLVEPAGHRLVVAVEGEHRLERRDRLARLAHGEETSVADRGRRHPMADPGRREAIPGEILAGILLAGGRHVGMGQHPRRRDRMAGEDVGAEGGHGRDLHLRIGRQAAVMARMDDLDSDGAGIDVADPRPGRPPGMPSPLGLRHELHHAPVLEDEVMGRDLRLRVAQARERALGRRHAGVVQDQHVDPRADPRAAIGRGQDLGGGGVGGKGHRRPRSAPIRSQAALIAASRRVAIATASGGRPRASARSG